MGGFVELGLGVLLVEVELVVVVGKGLVAAVITVIVLVSSLQVYVQRLA